MKAMEGIVQMRLTARQLHDGVKHAAAFDIQKSSGWLWSI